MPTPVVRALRRVLQRSPLHRPYTSLKYRLSSSAREDLFGGFYRDNVWGDAQSASGSGSSLEQTERLRAELPALLRRLDVSSLLDVPCGDFAWMRHVDLTGIDYVGADIVDELVERLERQFGGPARHFRRLDVVSDRLPAVDAVLVRDLFLHLPTRSVRQAVANIRSSGATWLLTSHYPGVTVNGDVRMGSHRFLNLTLPPFGWPHPVHAIDERPTTDEGRADKQLAAWRVGALPRR